MISARPASGSESPEYGECAAAARDLGAPPHAAVQEFVACLNSAGHDRKARVTRLLKHWERILHGNLSADHLEAHFRRAVQDSRFAQAVALHLDDRTIHTLVELSRTSANPTVERTHHRQRRNVARIVIALGVWPWQILPQAEPKKWSANLLQKIATITDLEPEPSLEKLRELFQAEIDLRAASKSSKSSAIIVRELVPTDVDAAHHAYVAAERAVLRPSARPVVTRSAKSSTPSSREKQSSSSPPGRDDDEAESLTAGVTLRRSANRTERRQIDSPRLPEHENLRQEPAFPAVHTAEERRKDAGTHRSRAEGSEIEVSSDDSDSQVTDSDTSSNSLSTTRSNRQSTRYPEVEQGRGHQGPAKFAPDLSQVDEVSEDSSSDDDISLRPHRRGRLDHALKARTPDSEDQADSDSQGDDSLVGNDFDFDVDFQFPAADEDEVTMAAQSNDHGPIHQATNGPVKPVSTASSHQQGPSSETSIDPRQQLRTPESTSSGSHRDPARDGPQAAQYAVDREKKVELGRALEPVVGEFLCKVREALPSAVSEMPVAASQHMQSDSAMALAWTADDVRSVCGVVMSQFQNIMYSIVGHATNAHHTEVHAHDQRSGRARAESTVVQAQIDSARQTLTSKRQERQRHSENISQCQITLQASQDQLSDGASAQTPPAENARQELLRQIEEVKERLATAETACDNVATEIATIERDLARLQAARRGPQSSAHLQAQLNRRGVALLELQRDNTRFLEAMEPFLEQQRSRKRSREE